MWKIKFKETEKEKKKNPDYYVRESIDRFEYCDIDSKIAVFAKVLCHGGLKY